MPLQIVRDDITKMEVDVIVNSANHSLLGGGGLDGCIHAAAGPELRQECEALHGCNTGDAKLTKGYNLPCKYIIHTVGPRWKDGRHGEPTLLASCYRTSLQIAKENQCESIAFPLISSGIYGYPKDQALRTAVNTISAFLQDNDMMVYLVVFDQKSYQIGDALYGDIESYIDDNYAVRHYNRSRRRRRYRTSESDVEQDADQAPQVEPTKALTLEEELSQVGETFSEMLLRKIDEKGITDAECYRKANVDRRLFSKIRSDRLYKPSKPTVIAFAFALELPLNEMQELLATAGYTLSNSSKFDIIIMYCVEHEKYDVNEVNEVLFAFDQALIGA